MVIAYLFTSTQLIQTGLSQKTIPPLLHNNQLFESDLDKANILNKYFASHSKVKYPDKSLPNVQRPNDFDISSIIVSEQDVKDILATLKFINHQVRI